ncbi:aminopeptidase [Deinococcus irradiatisoli]|uniref:Aminopeptidase n=1 Tax=Deinococcus irradiatisoli TaxID=2202254 RepID=A0A2Z3JJ53_9DEIO|nr:P1 family peptidase [Deinococcus irradiatisoli]AWN21978.1 aminopeptidase [Deinococcus irradiatisoli]
MPNPRDLGLPFRGQPGRFNAITDVPGVQVGHVTLISGEGPTAVRTGVSAILPGGPGPQRPQVPAAWFSLNGNGEMTGTTWIDESGWLTGPIMLTNTNSVGVVRDAVVAWGQREGWDALWSLPVVAETYDGFLNDIGGFHVTAEHAFTALDTATGGPVLQGNVGGGTGMIVSGFKGGIGTASRVLDVPVPCTIGVLVQANFGAREDLMILGVPIGLEVPEKLPQRGPAERDGSIIILVATDAPLLPHQLKRLARRAGLGLARTGSVAHNGSGDLFLAFSTAVPRIEAGVEHWSALPQATLDPLFRATVEATEEAIVNALFAAETMTGLHGRTVHALPQDRTLDLMRRYGRLRG